jgi:hypothetical protein
MKAKKIIAIMLICVLAMTTAVGCSSPITNTNKETEEVTSETAGIDVSTIVIDDKYLDWKEADYNKGSLEDRMNVYATYIYIAGEAAGFGDEYNEAEFKAEIAATYTAEVGDEIMKAVYTTTPNGTLQDAIDTVIETFESALEQGLKTPE